MVESSSLENCRAFTRTVSSNLTPSASLTGSNLVSSLFLANHKYRSNHIRSKALRLSKLNLASLNFVSVVLFLLQKFIKIAKISPNILSFSVWVVPFQKRYALINTGFIAFLSNFSVWVCECNFDDFYELFYQ